MDLRARPLLFPATTGEQGCPAPPGARRKAGARVIPLVGYFVKYQNSGWSWYWVSDSKEKGEPEMVFFHT
jgi:hypothetical protein